MIFQGFSTPSAQSNHHTDLAEDTLQQKNLDTFICILCVGLHVHLFLCNLAMQ